MERFAPNPEPVYGHIFERGAAQFAASPPSFHTEVTARTLDLLAPRPR